MLPLFDQLKGSGIVSCAGGYCHRALTNGAI